MKLAGDLGGRGLTIVQTSKYHEFRTRRRRNELAAQTEAEGVTVGAEMISIKAAMTIGRDATTRLDAMTSIRGMKALVETAAFTTPGEEAAAGRVHLRTVATIGTPTDDAAPARMDDLGRSPN